MGESTHVAEAILEDIEERGLSTEDLVDSRKFTADLHKLAADFVARGGVCQLTHQLLVDEEVDAVEKLLVARLHRLVGRILHLVFDLLGGG